LVDAVGDIGKDFFCHVQQVINSIVGEAIINMPTALFTRYQTTIAQASKMVGDVGLAESSCMYNLADIQWLSS